MVMIKIEKCPLCGKEFVCHDQSVYKLRYKNKFLTFCSWTCYRKAEKLKDEGKLKEIAENKTADSKIKDNKSENDIAKETKIKDNKKE